ncbi:hypothetical protein [Jatrophihabitans endophyticus]|uniref:DoxX family protein n=1 Tax=Jatrophihabitans endophyticus TaxID=1206085 RepID=UPI0019DDC9E3|nr:hypothetical protein [Jatrophihabitans endophyticus]MBE7190214.1 DoxX family membrane protein [Jatrophihabitans endophyticus]
MFRRPPSGRDTNVGALALSGLLCGAGLTHVAFPAFFDAMIPRVLPGRPRQWTYGSAAVEVAVGASIALPRTRRQGALAAALLFVGVLPANVTMAWDARHSDSTAYRLGTILRLPFQAPLIVWALRVRRAS